MLTDEADLRRWYDRYLGVFAALCRGERDDVDALLEFYDVPILVAADPEPARLADDAAVLGFAREQVQDARASGYARTDVRAATITLLRPGCAWFQGDFSRHRADGSAISRFTASYLVVEAAARRRMAVLVLHEP